MEPGEAVMLEGSRGRPEAGSGSPAQASDGAGPVPPPGTRNLKVLLEYDGTSYFGWQSQDGRRTVQGEVERALGRVVDHPVTIYGSGRTDRGVHALGQVANFRTHKKVPVQKLLLGTNTYLPGDIRVRAVEDVPDGFHARHSALGKRYRYTIIRSAVERVMIRRYCLAMPVPLDVAAMQEGASQIHGMRDYRSLRGNAKRRAPQEGEEVRSTVRTVSAVLVRESGPFVSIDAFGRGFLYGMVRAIAGTLIEMALGKRDPAGMESVLASLDRRRAGFTAPAQGLCLLEVYYGEGDLERAVAGARSGAEERPGAPSLEFGDALKMLT